MGLGQEWNKYKFISKSKVKAPCISVHRIPTREHIWPTIIINTSTHIPPTLEYLELYRSIICVSCNLISCSMSILISSHMSILLVPDIHLSMEKILYIHHNTDIKWYLIYFHGQVLYELYSLLWPSAEWIWYTFMAKCYMKNDIDSQNRVSTNN